ncbi:hypothetical protein FHR90_003301 [Endobacter medicaginis]|uniref:Uncharacterized protein n=1 Tax=Endobacter medicaginis TaxID=1181271 RepID=A0A850NJN1_9PROT|nr:hypothetical protein [Endobacter medicaginis]MBB3175445.1 hypothetical protein [Endobacter medicaginis]MCX5477120.1 hypothetical protein [Endobacter medicaginis]NVN29823.1 hypothetical protein [Endobacter medicaginis]
MTYNPNFVAGSILHAADLNGAFNAVESDISANTSAIAAVQTTASAANAAASAASAAAAAAQATANAAVPSSALGVSVATLSGGSLPVSQLPSSGIVTSINGKTGAVTSSPADYQLAVDTSSPKPVLNTFTLLTSSAYPPVAGSLTDAGDCLLLSNVSNSGYNSSYKFTAVGAFKAIRSIDQVVMVCEPDPNWSVNGNNGSLTYGPQLGLGLLLSSGTKIYCPLGVFMSTGGNYFWTGGYGQQGTQSGSNLNAADCTNGGTASAMKFLALKRLWFRVSGIQSGNLVVSGSVDGRIWYQGPGTSQTGISGISHVGFYGICATSVSPPVPNVSKIIGWAQFDSSGNAITAY